MKISDFLNEEKTRLDPACWSNKKIGTPKTKVKGGVRVNNCVPAESVAEAANAAQQAAIAIAKKKKAGVKEAFNPVNEGMPCQGMTEADMTRRGFLQGAGAAAMAGVAGSALAQSAEEKKANALRDENLARMRAMQGGNSNPAQSYAQRLRNRLLPNLMFTGDATGDPQTTITVKISSDGTITNLEISKPSGNIEWDNAVVRAVQKSNPLPIPTDGSPTPPDITFSLRPGMATKTKESVNQGVAEGFNGEYDDEAGMAQGNLYTIAKAAQGLLDTIDDRDNLPEWAQEKIAKVEGMLVTVWNYLQSQKAQGIDPEINEMYEAMDQLAEEMAIKNRVSKDLVWESFEALPDNMLYETAAWRRKEGKSAKGGLNAKGVASYRRENPGSKLQTAVTTKPSKLKPGSKSAKRRKSFCARMSGVKGPAKKPNGKPTRKTLALRKWNC